MPISKKIIETSIINVGDFQVLIKDVVKTQEITLLNLDLK